MSYRILVVNHDYGHFTDQLYSNDQRLASASFAEQHDARMKTFFGVNNFYSSNLCKLGHEAIDLIYNNRFMQYAWAVENGLIAKQSDHCEKFIRSLPDEWLAAVFQAQVIKFKPDVLVNLCMPSVTSNTLKKIKSHVPLIIGQHASPITPSMQDLSAYDLIVSSLPNLVEHFKSQGKQSAYFRLGFEAEILNNIAPVKEKSVDLAFVGGFSTHHLGGAKLFDFLAEQGFSMALYGYGQESLSRKAASFFRGPLFGLGMYDLYASSKIVINRHIDVSGEYANNMRLYEGTGAGVFVLTDAKTNLDTLFKSGTEIAAYNSIEECAELARYYLDHDKEREQIASHGQRRTLSEHTYYHRMSDLLGIIEEYSGMAGKSSGSITATVTNPQNNSSISIDRPNDCSVSEFEKLKNSRSYTLSGSLDAVLKTIRENLESFPRRVPGKLNLDGRDFYYADLHSFYYQSMQIFVDKNYEFESEADKPVILDCGAHIGLASIFFAGRYPNAMIYAFEADPLIAQMCEENIKSFGLSDRVKVFNKAVWTHNNGIQFNASCDDSGYITDDKTSGGITTPSVRLRDLIQDQPIEYIKLDIEGSEFEVIKDCKEALSNVNKIIVEVHQLGKMAGASSELLKVLEESNFSYVFDDLNSAPWVEEFKKPPFPRLKTDKYYLTVYAWQQSKVSEHQYRTNLNTDEFELTYLFRKTDLDNNRPVNKSTTIDMISSHPDTTNENIDDSILNELVLNPQAIMKKMTKILECNQMNLSDPVFCELISNPQKVGLSHKDLEGKNKEQKAKLIAGEYFAIIAKYSGQIASDLLFSAQWHYEEPDWFDHRHHILYPEKHFTDFWTMSADNVIRVMPLHGKLLNLCSGDGFYDYHFYRKRAKELVCVDVDHQRAPRLYKAENISYIQHDVLTYQPQESYFDTVVIRGAIEHFLQSDQQLIFRKAFNALKPGGWFCGDTPANAKTEVPLLGAHKNEWENETEMRRELEKVFSHVETYAIESTERTTLFWQCRKEE